MQHLHDLELRVSLSLGAIIYESVKHEKFHFIHAKFVVWLLLVVIHPSAPIYL
uniref:Uncharacterized protein n=1 Tax=Rhizophora mucronata TaxID=61149 RepID=A0A2P2NJD8_RHIMU